MNSPRFVQNWVSEVMIPSWMLSKPLKRKTLKKIIDQNAPQLLAFSLTAHIIMKYKETLSRSGSGINTNSTERGLVQVPFYFVFYRACTVARFSVSLMRSQKGTPMPRLPAGRTTKERPESPSVAAVSRRVSGQAPGGCGQPNRCPHGRSSK